MSEFNITPEKVELENGDIEIVRLNNNLIFRDNAQGITLTIDQDTELSQLWNAFDSQIDTSQFFQENASGLAELLSGYAGIDLAGEDIENANVVNASTGEFGSVNTGNVAIQGNTSTDTLTIGDSLINSETLDINDDDFETIDLQNDTIVMIVGNRNAGASGIFLTRFDIVGSSFSSSITTISSTALDGTTGNDGDLSFSRVDNTGYLENRTGTSLSIEVLEFNA